MKQHKYTTNIPYARKQLLKIADSLDDIDAKAQAAEIREIVSLYMKRRPGSRRAAITRNPVTENIKRDVVWLLKNTDLPQEEIAQKFNLDGGRVSEIYRTIRN